jgi:hypothetical protein
MNVRAPLTIFFFLSVLLFPWWVTACAGTVLLFVSEGYEVLAGGFLSDVLYAAPVPAFRGFMFVATACAFLLLISVRVAKRYLMHYPRTL